MICQIATSLFVPYSASVYPPHPHLYSHYSLAYPFLPTLYLMPYQLHIFPPASLHALSLSAIRLINIVSVTFGNQIFPQAISTDPRKEKWTFDPLPISYTVEIHSLME